MKTLLEWTLGCGAEITAGVHRRYSRSDFRAEIDALKPFASLLGDAYELFVSDPAMTHLALQLRGNDMQITARDEKYHEVETILSQERGYSLLKELSSQGFMICHGHLEIPI